MHDVIRRPSVAIEELRIAPTPLAEALTILRALEGEVPVLIHHRTGWPMPRISRLP